VTRQRERRERERESEERLEEGVGVSGSVGESHKGSEIKREEKYLDSPYDSFGTYRI
jgi:hypothetical protein